MILAKIGCKKKEKSTFLAQKMYKTAKFLNIYLIFSNIDNKNNKISQKKSNIINKVYTITLCHNCFFLYFCTCYF